MTLAGFSAETSLYETRLHYRSTGLRSKPTASCSSSCTVSCTVHPGPVDRAFMMMSGDIACANARPSGIPTLQPAIVPGAGGVDTGRGGPGSGPRQM